MSIFRSRAARSIAAVFMWLAPLALIGQIPSGCMAPLGVGYRILQVPGGAKMAVWYPSSDRENPFRYSADFSSTLAVNGTPASCSRFPLIVFSHGYLGCGTQSIFVTEQLARAGYIVAAPDHSDAGCSVDGGGSPQYVPLEQSFFAPETWTDATYADRKDDIHQIIDWFYKSSLFDASLDRTGAGIVGHSLGGYTALGVIGAWKSWKDERIKAALLLSPYVLPFLSGSRLQLDVPVMAQGAQLDIAITPFLKTDQGAFGQLSLPKYFIELRGGSHYEWTNLLCANRATVAGCLASNANAKLIVDYGAGFLDRYLKQRPMVVATLNGNGLATYRRTVPLSTLQAASYARDAAVAPESIVSGFGDPLAAQTESAQGTPLPLQLSNLSVTVRDSRGVSRRAPLILSSPNQINYIIPANTQSGTATTIVNLGSETIAEGQIRVDAVAPSVFTANASGSGAPAAQFLRVREDGSRTLTYAFDPSTLQPLPIDLGGPGDRVFLIIYGSGMRGRKGVVEAVIGGQAVPVAGPVPQSEFPGLDQLNLGPLPNSLAARGIVDLVIEVDGKKTNPVRVHLR